MLAIGAVTVVNRSIVGNDPIDWRVPIAAGAAAVVLAAIEKGSPEFAVGLAWLALLTTVLTPLGGRRAPAETILNYINGK
jgi:hypothetical protein